MTFTTFRRLEFQLAVLCNMYSIIKPTTIGASDTLSLDETYMIRRDEHKAQNTDVSFNARL